MIRSLVAALVLAFVPAAALAQATPAASPVPAPSPSTTPAPPSPYFPALGNNDPCTSLSATVASALEFDVAPPSLARTNAGGLTTGTTNAGAGLKYVFGYTPKFNDGGQIFVTAPTGLNDFSAGGSQTTYALQAGYTLSPKYHYVGFGASYYL